MYMPKGGAVSVPGWVIGLRALQLIFALLSISTTAYPLSVDSGGPVQPPLIATIIIACFTIIPILVLTTPLHLSQRKVYDPRIALLLDGFAALFWLASFAALASYQDIYSLYGKSSRGFDVEFNGCLACKRAWRSGVASAVFAAIELVLFLLTTLFFIYYYHCELAGIRAPGISSRKTGAAAGAATAGAAAAKEHQMQPMPAQGCSNDAGNYGGAAPQISGAYGNSMPATSGPPYRDTPARSLR